MKKFTMSIKCPNCGEFDHIFASGVIHYSVKIGISKHKTLVDAKDISQCDPSVRLVKCHKCSKEWNSIDELTNAMQKVGYDVITEQEAFEKYINREDA